LHENRSEIGKARPLGLDARSVGRLLAGLASRQQGGRDFVPEALCRAASRFGAAEVQAMFSLTSRARRQPLMGSRALALARLTLSFKHQAFHGL